MSFTKFVSIHERKVQILATETYKVSNNFPSAHMNELSEVRNEHLHNLRQNSHFSWLLVKSVNQYITKLKVFPIYSQKFEIYSRYLDCLILYIDGLDKFQKAIKKWKPENYPWRICKKYISNVDFIQKTMLELFIG